jgi:tetratricopeptide (TPR) repeat protein
MTSPRSSFCVAGFLLGAALVLGQTRSGGQNPPATGVGNTPTTPSPTTTTTQPATTQQPTTQQQTGFPDMQRPMFLSGKVVMDDGTPPPDPVVIERVCNGIPKPEAYTDLKGHFSFQLGQTMNMMPDASYGSNMDYGAGAGLGNTGQLGSTTGMNNRMGGGAGERDLNNCELRANLAGFRSDSVSLVDHRVMDNPDIGTIILHRLGNVEGLTISATSLMAPKDARKAYEKALESVKKKKWDDAEKSLQKAVDIYPKYASAWYQLGLVSEQQKDVEGARKAYAASLAADAKFVSPYMQLAGISVREKKWQDVADTTDRVLSLNAVSFPGAYFYNALANYELHKLDPAEKSAAEGQKLDTARRYPQFNHLLGVILAEKRDFKGAAENLRLYLKLVPNANDSDLVRKQLTEVEKLANATDVSQQKAQE